VKLRAVLPNDGACLVALQVDNAGPRPARCGRGYEDPEAFRALGQRTFEQWKEIAESLDLYATG